MWSFRARIPVDAAVRSMELGREYGVCTILSRSCLVEELVGSVDVLADELKQLLCGHRS